ncbi:MAG TPA: hypothetical protein VFV50_08840 [Bdellovibrionales bacterium]|nr:hypothetical protein [Bdellovibrionales bacterium]
MKYLVLALLIAAAPVANADDATHISAFAGAGYSAVDAQADGTADVTREPGTAYGASIATPAFGSTDVEIGAVRQQDTLHIPLMLRLGTEKLFTAGAGVFGETGIGARDDRDFVFGWNLTAGLNFDLADRVNAFAEGRYLQDFDGATDDGGLLALAGLRFALQ